MSSTLARFSGGRWPEPLNSTSCMVSPRRWRADVSPSTQRTASITFDLPQPLGPTMPTSCPGTGMWVGSTKDLKPARLICLSLKVAVLVWREGRCLGMYNSQAVWERYFSCRLARMPAKPVRRLATFANPQPARDYRIHMEIPEFTCLCPKTGQPDFATLVLDYVPDRLCVELKSLKLYIWSYRNEGAFHEA